MYSMAREALEFQYTSGPVKDKPIFADFRTFSPYPSADPWTHSTQVIAFVHCCPSAFFIDRLKVVPLQIPM